LRDGVTASGDRLVSEDSMEQMFEPHQLVGTGYFYPTTALTKPNWRSYGLGWFQQDFQGRKIDYHTGSLSGLVAIIGLDRPGDKAVVVLANRDHAEVRHALLWEVMDNSAADHRQDWNQQVFDLYESRAAQSEERWQERQQKRLEGTGTSLPLAAYAGTYRSEAMGDVLLEMSGKNLVLKTTRRDFEMSHWHLDTFLVEYKNWNMREFASFNIGPDGAIVSFDLFNDTFRQVGEG
jgi:hypothetical protein